MKYGKLSLLLALTAFALTGCIDALFGPSESGEGTSYGSPNEIPISNNSFESPSLEDPNEEGLLESVDDWQEGGSWYGRIRWKEAIPDGDYGVWSSVYIDGSQPELGREPDNGFSQELSQAFEVGQYTLTIKALGDNTEGLTSRLILGYESGDNNYVEIAHQDTSISYDPDVNTFSYAEAWHNQVLTVQIESDSAAVGKPIWVRFTSTTAPSGEGGNSCWWDDVSLSVSYPKD